MRRGQERTEIIEGAEVRINIVVIGDVVTVVAHWRWIKRQKPEGGDAEFLEVIEFLDQPAKIADAVAVAIVKRLDVELVDDGVLVPERVYRRILRRVRHETRQLAQEATGRNARYEIRDTRYEIRDARCGIRDAEENYFFGSAMAWAATHCHS